MERARRAPKRLDRLVDRRAIVAVLDVIEGDLAAAAAQLRRPSLRCSMTAPSISPRPGTYYSQGFGFRKMSSKEDVAAGKHVAVINPSASQGSRRQSLQSFRKALPIAWCDTRRAAAETLMALPESTKGIDISASKMRHRNGRELEDPPNFGEQDPSADRLQPQQNRGYHVWIAAEKVLQAMQAAISDAACPRLASYDLYQAAIAYEPSREREWT